MARWAGTLLFVLVVLSVLNPPVQAGRDGISGLIIPLVHGRTLTAYPTLGCTVTCDVKRIGTGEIQGMDWDFTSDGTPSVNFQFRQCNLQTGTPTLWSNPTIAGTSVTNNVTATHDRDGTNLGLAPGDRLEVLITNMDSAAVTINSSDLFNQ